MRAPILFPLIALMTGIFIADRFPLPVGPIPLAIGGALSLLGIALTLLASHSPSKAVLRKIDLTFAVVLFLSVFCVGYSLTLLSTPHRSAVIDYTKPHLMELRIEEPPSWTAHSIKVTTSIVHFQTDSGWYKLSTFPFADKVVLFLEPNNTAVNLQYGDHLIACCQLQLPATATNPHQFNYATYLKRKGILFQAYLHDWQYRLVASDKKENGMKICIFTLRRQLIGIIQQSALSASQKGIAEALLLGYRNDIDPTTQSQFRSAGITHLLCVSGLHVGIIASIIGFCLSFLNGRPRNRILKGGIQLLGVWGFILLSGLAPSALRAGVMFSFLIVGHMYCRRPPSLNVLAASALILLLFKPMLLFDIGFRLSYSAVLGILIFYKPLKGLIPLSPLLQTFKIYNVFSAAAERVWSLACISTVAQISTLPWILYYFHQFPIYFLAANLTIVPLAGLLLGTIIIMIGLSWWPSLFHICTQILSLELVATDRITLWISELPGSMIHNIYADSITTLLLVVFLLLLGINIYYQKRIVHRAILSALPICLVGYLFAINLIHLRQREIDIYSAGQTTAIEYFQGKNSQLFINTESENSIDYQSQNNLVSHGTRHRELSTLDTCSHFLSLGSVRLLVVDRTNCHIFLEIKTSIPRFSIHYVVLSESPYLHLSQLQSYIDFDTLIITANNSPRYRRRWHRECDSLHIPYYDIAEQGAFVLKHCRQK